MKRSIGVAGASLASIGAAFVASLCCIGPVLFVTLGVGAGLASGFEPLRPVFTGLSVGLLALGFYTVYGRRPAGDAGGSCDLDGSSTVALSRTRDVVLLWSATLFALVVLSFPAWSKFLV